MSYRKQVDNDGLVPVEVWACPNGSGEMVGDKRLGVVSPGGSKVFEVDDGMDVHVLEIGLRQALLQPLPEDPSFVGSPPEVLIGSSTQPAIINIGLVEYQIGDIVNMAYVASGLTLEEWNSQDDETRNGRIDDQINLMIDQVPIDPAVKPKKTRRSKG